MTRTLGEFLLGALVTGIIAGLGAYFGSYLRESGRQRAIEESVARLTNTTEEIKAAVSGAGLSNWLSYYGTNNIDTWMLPYFGASVYDDPGVYAKSSPIQFIKNVKTPTLIVVGERDAECPAPQSYEFWHALRTLGVPTELVVYAGEGHRFMNPKNRVDFQDRTTAWFQKYLK